VPALPHPDYLAELVARLRAGLGEDLVAAILGGSAGLGAYEPGRSDLDVLAVVDRPPGGARLRALAPDLLHASLPCPARKLELVVMTRATVAGKPGAPAYELNLGTGAGQPDVVELDPAAEAAHWFVIDRAIARSRGRSLLGPPAREVLAPVPRHELVAAVHGSLDWHQAHETASPDTVLNASRAWHWACTGRWASKARAAEWARDRLADPGLVDAAVAARRAGGELDPAAVAAFLDAMRAAIR
jgi:hypothetical protein